MEHEKIERINELARLKRARELTEDESREHAALRREYIDGFRDNMKAVLDNVRVKQPDGTLAPLKKKGND